MHRNVETWEAFVSIFVLISDHKVVSNIPKSRILVKQRISYFFMCFWFEMAPNYSHQPPKSYDLVEIWGQIKPKTYEKIGKYFVSPKSVISRYWKLFCDHLSKQKYQRHFLMFPHYETQFVMRYFLSVRFPKLWFGRIWSHLEPKTHEKTGKYFVSSKSVILGYWKLFCDHFRKQKYQQHLLMFPHYETQFVTR